MLPAAHRAPQRSPPRPESHAGSSLCGVCSWRGNRVRDRDSRALCRAKAQSSAAPTDSRGRSTRASSRRGSETPLNAVLARSRAKGISYSSIP